MKPDPYILGIADIAAIVIVLLISASIGVYFRFSGGRQRTTKEFLMAGRTMSPFPVVFSLIVTFVSAVMMLGIPSDVYVFGIYRILAYMCSTISNVISAYIFLPVYFQMGDSVSVYEYLERRFGKFTRKLSSVLFIVHSLFFMSVVLFAPALALSTVSEIDITTSIVSIGGICTIYCCMGGMKAVLWTDVFQAIIMYICVFAIFVKGILLAETNIPEAFQLIHAQNNIYKFFSFDPTVRYTVWNCILYGFLYGMYNYGCNQAQIQRMLSVKSLKLSQRAVVVSVPLAIIFIAMNFSLGIIMYANYHHDKDLIPRAICKRDEMVPYFITKSFTDYPGLAGLCIAGIFSGSLSTVSSSVNSLAAVTMEDFVRPYFATRRKLTDSTAAILVKVFACAYGLAGILCAFAVQGNNIVDAYTTLYGVTAGPILGLFTLGMMTITANEKGALIGLVSGIFTTTALGIVSLVKKAENSLSKKSCEERRAALFARSLNSTTFSTVFTDFTASIANASNFTDTATENEFTSTTDVSTTTGFFSTSAVIFNSTTDPTHETSGPPKGEALISIMWLFVLGFAITTIIGYIASLLKSLSENKAKEKISDVDPALLSPLVKKWIFKSLPQNDQGCSQELVKLNGSLES